MHHPTDRITHTTAFVTPVVEHWLEQEKKFNEKIKVGHWQELITKQIHQMGALHLVKIYLAVNLNSDNVFLQYTVYCFWNQDLYSFSHEIVVSHFNFGQSVILHIL